MTPLRMIFLALAIWGAIHPMYYFLSWYFANEMDFQGMIDAWYVNDSTTGLVWDLTITAIALTVWILADSVKRRDWLGPLAILAIGIGVSCALPLYLFLRSRPQGGAAPQAG